MNRKSRKFIRTFVISFLCGALLLGIGSLKAIPAQAEETGTVYTLVYPDNKTTETVKTYEEAQALAKEWKLLYTGTTAEDGNIVLPNWAKEGEIRIVETVIPEGYTAEETERIVDLSESETTFINKKKVEPKLEQPKEQPKEEPKTPVRIPKTGIDSLFVSLISETINPFKKFEVPEVHVEEQEEENDSTDPNTDNQGNNDNELDNDKIEELDQPINTNPDQPVNENPDQPVNENPDQPVNTGKDFTIHKVDQDKKPLKGATFEVYGKPTINEIKLVTITFKKIRTYPDYVGYSPEQVEITEKDFYLDEYTTIVIEASDDSGFKQEIKLKHDQEIELSLKPGKYKIIEPIPSDITMLDSSEVVYMHGVPTFAGYVLYHLNDYEVEIDNDGNVKSIGNESWIRLFRNYESPYKYYVDDQAEKYEDSPYKVEVEKTKITITNYASVVMHK